jgi:uncharacterized protein (DUF1330 family)
LSVSRIFAAASHLLIDPLSLIRIQREYDLKMGGVMSVYAIAQLWIQDPVAYGRYTERFMEVFRNYQGRVLAADDSPLIFEGTSDVNKVVVLSFPDETAFRAWAESPEYLAIAKDRRAGAKSVILLVKSIASRPVIPNA